MASKSDNKLLQEILNAIKTEGAQKGFEKAHESMAAKEEKEEAAKKRRKVLDEELKTQQDLLEAAKNAAKIEEDALKQYDAKLNLVEKEHNSKLAVLKILKEEGKETGKLHAMALEHYEKEKKSLEESKKIQEEKIGLQKESLGIVTQEANKVAESIGMQLDGKQSIIGKLSTILNLNKDNAKEMEKEILAAKEVFTWTNFWSSILEKVQEQAVMLVAAFANMAREINTTQAAFNRTTGAGGRYNAEMVDAVKNSREFGTTLESVSGAYSALISTMSKFTTLSTHQRKSLAATGAQMELAGVSAESFASNVDFLMAHMGMGADEAEKHQRKLVAFASSIGVTSAKMAEDFKAAQPVMAKYGKVVGDQVFKHLAKTAKAAGVEVSSLLSISAGFDTFEDSATKVGQLNALLGGPYLDSIEMLTAKEGERVDMLRQSLQMSGRTWADLGRFEKQSIATAAGISDMAEAGSLFGTTDSDFRKIQQEQKTLEEQTKASQDMQMRLNQIMMQFLPLAQKFVSRLEKIVDWVVEAAIEYEKIVAGIAAFIVTLGALVTVGGPLLAMYKLWTLATALQTAATAAQVTTTTISTTTTIADTGAKIAHETVTVTQTAAQTALNVATYAFPGTWIIGIFVAIAAAVALVVGLMWDYNDAVEATPTLAGRLGGPPTTVAPETIVGAQDGMNVTKTGLLKVHEGETVQDAARGTPLTPNQKTKGNKQSSTQHIEIKVGNTSFVKMVGKIIDEHLDLRLA